MRFRFNLIVILFGIVVEQNFGHEVSQAQIKSIANQFIQKQIAVGLLSNTQIVDIKCIQLSNGHQIHLANLNPQGFIILTNDTNLPPILAYSFNQDWKDTSDEENIFKNMIQEDIAIRKRKVHKTPTEILKKYNQQWQNDLLKISNADAIQVLIQWPPAGTTSTGGWIETAWKQRSPYNDMCPMDPDTNIRCAVGCVANTLAQIVNFHKSVGNLYFDEQDRYTTYDMIIDSDSTKLDFPSFKKLNTYLDSIRIKFAYDIELNDKDIAALNFACGILVSMSYDYEESSATCDFSNVLKEKMGYESADFHSPNSIFFSLLKENMMNGLPAGLIIKRSEDMAVHELVVDGYNTDGFYHLNFGSGIGWPMPINQAWYYLPEEIDAGFDIITSANLNIRTRTKHYDSLMFSKQSLTFNAVPLGEISDIKQIHLLNISGSPMQLSYRTASDIFLTGTSESDLDRTEKLISIMPGETKTIYVQCIPESIGFFETYLVIKNEDNSQIKHLPLSCPCIPLNGTPIYTQFVKGTWTVNQSPYYICRNIKVNPYDKLIIEPGVEVLFAGPYKLNIGLGAQLIAKGTKEDTINFKAAGEKTWSGINFLSSADNDTLSFCSISGIGTNLNKYGIYILRSNPVFDNLSIRNNFTKSSVIKMLGSRAILNKVKIFNNRTDSESIIDIIASYPMSIGDTRQYNVAAKSPLFLNSLICNNSSGTWGAVKSEISSPTFINVAISSNVTRGSFGAALHFLDAQDKIQFINSIIQSSETQIGPVLISPETQASLSFIYCNVDTNYEVWSKAKSMLADLDWGKGNISIDPCFEDAEKNDFTLRDGSPCIDMGNPSSKYDDLNDPEKPGYAKWPAKGTGRNDMGAYGGGQDDFNNPQITKTKKFILYQNYPNPFNSETTIKFYVPQAGKVIINIYNILGQRIKTFEYPQIFKGNYLIRWDGRDNQNIHVSSGLYFCTLLSDSYIQTRKLILLK